MCRQFVPFEGFVRREDKCLWHLAIAKRRTRGTPSQCYGTGYADSNTALSFLSFC